MSFISGTLTLFIRLLRVPRWVKLSSPFPPKVLREIICFFLVLSFKDLSLYGAGDALTDEKRCPVHTDNRGWGFIQFKCRKVHSTLSLQFILHTLWEFLRHTSSTARLIRTSILRDERGYKLSPEDKDYQMYRKYLWAKMNLQASAFLKSLIKEVVNLIIHHL